MLVVLFALTILGLEYGVMMEESFTLETLSLILQSSRYTILKWKKFNINPQVAMDYEPTTGNTSFLSQKQLTLTGTFLTSQQ